MDPQRITSIPRLDPRAADSNKGSFGRVLVVAGSRTMPGAAILCATAALRGGAGLVRLAVPQGIASIVAAANPCYTLALLPQDEDGRLSRPAIDALVEHCEGSTAVVAGPGLGMSVEVGDVVGSLLELEIPLVLDADALNVLAARGQPLGGDLGPRVITPHPGEFSRLTGNSIAEIQADREEKALRFAAKQQVVLVLKGHQTVVTDGRRIHVNTTGNPGMATGGTGDVLAGLIAALLGQKLESFAAAQLGVYLHGMAGDLASQLRGEASLIATDLLEFLPEAFRARASAAE